MTFELQDHQAGPTFGGLTKRTLERWCDRVAFKWEGGSVTYAEALLATARYQHALRDAGLQKGQGVAALGGNRYEVWVLGSAVQAMGCYVTWLHPMGSMADQMYQIQDSKVSMLVIDEQHHAERGAQLVEEMVSLGVTARSMGPSSFAEDLNSAAEKFGDVEMILDCGPEDICVLNYTGGTTGQPKGAYRRQHQWTMAVLDLLADFDIPSGAQYLLVAPMSHVAGTKVLPTLVRGGTVHLLNGFDPAKILETIEREKITLALFVPTMIYALLDHPDLDKRDLSSLQMLLYGASPMSLSRLKEGLDRIGPVFSQLYGQTELYPVSVLSREDHDLSRPELLLSCGRPVTGVDVTIRDMDNNELPVGEVGEICINGASAMVGYWNRDDLNAETLAGGWVHTGDIGKLDENGYLYIVDRKKDMIITGGFNVFPREVEDALTSHPDVASAAVYGIPDEKWGEQVTASVVLKPGASVDPEVLIAHVKDLKGGVQAPKFIEILPELPSTAVGKIDKKALRARMSGD